MFKHDANAMRCESVLNRLLGHDQIRTRSLVNYWLSNGIEEKDKNRSRSICHSSTLRSCGRHSSIVPRLRCARKRLKGIIEMTNIRPFCLISSIPYLLFNTHSTPSYIAHVIPSWPNARLRGWQRITTKLKHTNCNHRGSLGLETPRVDSPSWGVC